MLLAAGVRLSNTTGNHDWNVVHVAAHGDHVITLALLLRGAPALVDSKTSDGTTLVQLAALGGHEKAVSCTLSVARPAQLHLADLHSALLSAVIKGYTSVVGAMIDYGIEVGPPQSIFLQSAVLFGHAASLKILLEAGPARGREPNTAYTITVSFGPSVGGFACSMLHAAAGFGHVLMIHVLLSLGEDKAAMDMCGGVPSEVLGGMDMSQVIQGFLGSDSIKSEMVQALIKRRMTPGDQLAIQRMLARGPEYPAISWVWPTATGPATGDTAAVTARPSAEAAPREGTLGLRVLRCPLRCKNFIYGIMSR